MDNKKQFIMNMDMDTDNKNSFIIDNRTYVITPCRKGVKAFNENNQLTKIKCLKISVICGLYDAYIVYENDIEQNILSFVLHNVTYIKSDPCTLQDIFTMPPDIDPDIRDYIICNKFLNQLFMQFPARIYHYPHLWMRN